MKINSLTAKTLALTSLLGFTLVAVLPAQAEDIPASPMNHGGFSMPTSASAALAPPPPPPAEPAMPEKPMKKKRMAKKHMKKEMAGSAAAAPDGKM